MRSNMVRFISSSIKEFNYKVILEIKSFSWNELTCKKKLTWEKFNSYEKDITNLI